ncbi:hypothetical protein QAD02_019567 [Eretmocerus hayati]|uniref:Uncharacterized protein n=1 Tax=Eretmocerus hayati TaxID=131215 RepID=A0ACC2PPR0_9HYME|nr:hypothetical protein QAD02_019567 [Eretmocerus hayati]
MYAAGPSSSTSFCTVQFDDFTLPPESCDINHVYGESADESTSSSNIHGGNPSQKISMENHSATHLNERAYPCQYCHKIFSRLANLRRHMKLHTGNIPYSCDICGRRCRDTSVLREHMRIHTGESPFTCGICGNNFKQQGQLITHTKTHRDMEPFPCSICDSKFKLPRELKRHMLIHMSSELLTCQICKKSLRSRKNLNTHMKIHSKIRTTPATGENEIDDVSEDFLLSHVNGFDPLAEMEMNELRHQDVSEILERALLGHHSEDSCDEETRMKINSIIEDINKSYKEKYGN